MNHFIQATVKPRNKEELMPHTVSVGHRDTGIVLQIYRQFGKGHAQSYRSERRSYRLLKFIFVLRLCYLFLPCSCAYSRSRNVSKFHAQELRRRPRFASDVCYKHCTKFHTSPHLLSPLPAVFVYKKRLPIFVTLSSLTDEDPGLGRNI